MATAIDRTIPCERCNTQINVHDWPWHSRQCTNSGEHQTKTTEKDKVEETHIDGIPCEYCNAQINLDEWESHSKQCADAHKRRIENLKNGINDDENESVQTTIPCEYCGQSISLHDWEWHSVYKLIFVYYIDHDFFPRYCRDNVLIPIIILTNNIEDNDNNESIEILIPCEYCSVPISIHNLTWHTRQCADAEKQQIENIARSLDNEPNDALIPCEYCDKSFTLKLIGDHQTECRRKLFSYEYQPNASFDHAFGGDYRYPKDWIQSSPYNLSRYTLEPNSEEYKFVEQKFHKSLPSNPIVQIERIQNRRWYRQYDAHRDDFIERYGKSTEQWLFHGCKSPSVDAIINDCFNRSHGVRFAAGQGIYFATDANISISYTQPDAENLRHMFMARVLVGKTVAGNQSTRVCPPGYDTTGGGNVFVTYHDAQAYGEYLITFR